MDMSKELHTLNWQVENLKCRIGCLGITARDITTRRRIERMINGKLLRIVFLELKLGSTLFEITDDFGKAG